MSCDVGKAIVGLMNELWCGWSDGKVGEWAEQSSFSNLSIALPTSQFILQPFRCFTYVTAHSTTLLSLLLRHRIFTYVTWRAAHENRNTQFRISIKNLGEEPLFTHFTYVTTHSPTLPSLYLRHTSFSNPSVASPTSQFILQPFFRFSYVTRSSLNTPGEPPMQRTIMAGEHTW